MNPDSQKGRLTTGRTIVLLLALLGAVGVTLWYSGYLPLRWREDGLYGGGTVGAGCANTIERPKLYLPAPARVKPGHVAVIRVIDGDTIEVERSGKKESVRLIGIDTDEVGKDRVDPVSPGWRATMFVFELLEPDAQVKLEFDNEREDKYGRTLAYVYLPDGRMLNEEIMRAGWAQVMRIEPNSKHAGLFREREGQARKAGLGRWQ